MLSFRVRILTKVFERWSERRRDDSIAKSEKVFFLLSLSLSLLNCVLQQNSSSFYEVLYKIWDHFWKKKKRKERQNFGEDTYYVRTKWCLSVQKILAKEYDKPTWTEFLKPTETLLSSRIQQKTKTPNNNAQKKKWCVPRWKVAFSTLTRCEGSPPGGNALAVLYRRYCVELKVYDGWYISRARAGRTFFCSYSFCILCEGFSGFENYVVGLWYTFAKKNTFF